MYIYMCTFCVDICLKELIFSQLLLVVANLYNFPFFANKLVCTVLTDLLTRVC